MSGEARCRVDTLCTLPNGNHERHYDCRDGEYWPNVAYEAPPGSSVPEAARAAEDDGFDTRTVTQEAWAAGQAAVQARWPDMKPIDAALLSTHAIRAAAPHIVAAASVELQQEVDRLSTECEALRGTVAEERATTGRRIGETVNGHVTFKVFTWDRAYAKCHCGWVGPNRGGWPGPLSPTERVYQDQRDHVIDRLRAALASPGEES